MTEVQDWRGGAPRRHDHQPLPEPPRYRHVSKTGAVATDATGRVLDDWLLDLAVTTTIDAD